MTFNAWYPLLNNIQQKENSLCYNDSINNKVEKNKFVVCKEVTGVSSRDITTPNRTSNRTTNRLFASFENSDDFIQKTHYFDLDVEERSFYEIVCSDRNFLFKPFFDIDCDEKFISKEKIDKYILLFKNFLEKVFEKKLKVKSESFEILIYDSSAFSLLSKEGERGGDAGKKSFHIVIDGIFFNDMTTLKTFCLWCKNKFSSLGEKYFTYFSKHIDECVYKKNQQLRLLFSKKLGKDIGRLKRPFLFGEKGSDGTVVTTNGVQDPLYFISLFRKSLLTESQRKHEIITEDNIKFIYKDDDILHHQYSPLKSPSKKQFLCDLEDLNEKHSSFIEEYLEDGIFEIKDIIKTELSVEDDQDNIFIIVLKRNEESYCEKCKRSHDNENPYIVVFQKIGIIKFYCRREEVNTSVSSSSNGRVIYREIIDVAPLAALHSPQTPVSSSHRDSDNLYEKYFKEEKKKKKKEKEFSYI